MVKVTGDMEVCSASHPQLVTPREQLYGRKPRNILNFLPSPPQTPTLDQAHLPLSLLREGLPSPFPREGSWKTLGGSTPRRPLYVLVPFAWECLKKMGDGGLKSSGLLGLCGFDGLSLPSAQWVSKGQH